MGEIKDILEDQGKGNWNPAKHYSNLKVMKHLYVFDELQSVALFGSEFFLNQNELSSSRIEALKKMAYTLKVLIENTHFAVKKGLQADMDKFYEKLGIIESFIPKTYKKINNFVTKTHIIKINEEYFKILFERLIQIKKEVNDPLNKSNLIFTFQEEFDPQAHKKKIFDEATGRG